MRSHNRRGDFTHCKASLNHARSFVVPGIHLTSDHVDLYTHSFLVSSGWGFCSGNSRDLHAFSFPSWHLCHLRESSWPACLEHTYLLVTSAQVEINPLWTGACNCFFSWVNSFKKEAWRKVLPHLLKAAQCAAGAPLMHLPLVPSCFSKRHGVRCPCLAGHRPQPNPPLEGH